MAKAFKYTYVAEAPTRLEAAVLAIQTCIADGYHGMHCDIEECEKVESNSVSGRIGTGEVKIDGIIQELGGLFGL